MANPEMDPATRKADTGKPRYHLIMRDFANQMDKLVRLGTYGAKKYDDQSWQKSTVPDAYLDAAYRHMAAHNRGERIDPETGLPHMIHAAWNMFAVDWFADQDK